MGWGGLCEERGGPGCAVDLLRDHSSLSVSGSWFPLIRTGIYGAPAAYQSPDQVCRRYACAFSLSWGKKPNFTREGNQEQMQRHGHLGPLCLSVAEGGLERRLGQGGVLTPGSRPLHQLPLAYGATPVTGGDKWGQVGTGLGGAYLFTLAEKGRKQLGQEIAVSPSSGHNEWCGYLAWGSAKAEFSSHCPPHQPPKHTPTNLRVTRRPSGCV